MTITCVFSSAFEGPKFSAVAMVSILDFIAKNDPTTISLKLLYDFVKLIATNIEFTSTLFAQLPQ